MVKMINKSFTMYAVKEAFKVKLIKVKVITATHVDSEAIFDKMDSCNSWLDISRECHTRST